MARLPIPGSDAGQWGTILNDFLSQAHATDGKLKTDSVTAAQLASSSVVTTALASSAVTAAKIADGTITNTKLDTSAQASLAKADTAVQPGDLGTAATHAHTDYATAAQGSKADASDVTAITLTGPLTLTVPGGHPAGQVYRVTLTQDGVGGHTVTYDGEPVTVDTAAGAVTTVELHPAGAGYVVRYSTAAGRALTQAPSAAIQRRHLGLDAGLRKLARRLNMAAGGGVCIIGDSTGNDTTDWFYLLGQWIAARYPALTVEHTVFSDANTSYLTPTVIQTGTAGTSSVTVNSTRGPWINIAPDAFLNSDVDIAVRVSLPDWTPSLAVSLIAQSGPAGQRAFQLTVQATTGVLRYTPYSDGTNVPVAGSFTSTVAPGVVDGAPRWIRFTLDADDGAGNAVGKFWDGGANNTPVWVQIGDTITQAAVHTTNRPAGIPYMCGATNGGAVAVGGVFYRARLRNGIDGPLVADPVIARWATNPDSVTLTGAPVLTLWNGSIPGRNIAYLSNASRFPKLLPLVGTIDTVILSDCHNENTGGVEWIEDYAGMLAAIRTRAPQAALVGIVQNPQTSVNTNGFIQHNTRLAELRQYLEDATGVGGIDVQAAFVATGNPTAYIGGDGIHPTGGDAGGSGLWRDTVVAELTPLLA